LHTHNPEDSEGTVEKETQTVEKETRIIDDEDPESTFVPGEADLFPRLALPDAEDKDESEIGEDFLEGHEDNIHLNPVGMVNSNHIGVDRTQPMRNAMGQAIFAQCSQIEDMMKDHAKKLHAGILEQTRQERADIARHRIQSETDKKAMEGQRKAADDRVTLCVGGAVFETSVTTLTSISETSFTSYFHGHFKQDLDNKGQHFIDRDGALFCYILDPGGLNTQCWRDGAIMAWWWWATTSSSSVDVELSLPRLTSWCQNPVTDTNGRYARSALKLRYRLQGSKDLPLWR
jgi:hypothetical protein